MKKLFTLLTLTLFLASCSQDNDTTNIDPVSKQDMENQLSQGSYDKTDLGIYKGVFTTLDGQNRATVYIQLDAKGKATAEFGFPDGTKAPVSSAQKAAKGKVGSMSFSGNNFSFDFKVDSNGANPVVSNVTYMGEKGDIIIAKETSKAAVVTKTGVYECTSDCSNHPELGEPGAIQTFNTMLTGASNSDMQVQFTLNRNSYSGMLSQSDCQPGAFGDFTKCKLNGTVMANSGPVTINPNNNRNTYHRYRSDSRTGTCSDVVGVMTYKSSIFNNDPDEPEQYVLEFRTDNPVGEGGDCE